MAEEQIAQEEDIQISTYESLQQTNAHELYETLKTINTRCKCSRKSMVYAFRIILTATVIGTLTGVVVLFESTSGTSPNIVFKARNVTDRSPTAGQTMIFAATLVNEGNAYNTSTGIFTAPVNGTYSFSTQFCVYLLKSLKIAIIVDGVSYAAAHVYDKYSYQCHTADTVAVLHAHSKVRVKCNFASTGTVIYESVNFMNSFSGYLVHQQSF